MRGHKEAGEPRHTVRSSPRTTDLAAFRDHFAETVAFTDDLREGRCRRTNHFDARLPETVAVFRPLFSPWNMEILFLLYMKGPLRFNGLKRALSGVSSRVLTDKLRHLASTDLVARREEESAVTYALTTRGRVVARHLHPLVFYLHNEPRLADLEADPAALAAHDRA